MAGFLRRRAALPVVLITVGITVAAGLLVAEAGDAAGPGGTGTRAPAASRSGELLRPVIVTARAGRLAEAERAAVAAGGRVTRPLAVINGFAAVLPASAVPVLAASPAVGSVTPDRQVSAPAPAPAASTSGSGSVSAAKARSTAATVDTGAMSAVTQLVGARAAWAAGATGQGVDVALIDTGIAPVAGLDGAGKVLVGPDLSFDAPGAPTPGLDAYGHGTFMAGIIAGHDPAAPADPAAYAGVAPDARLVNVKVGAADGATDVSQVIAAIDWVTQHAHDPGVNIRVLNLSFGTDGTQDYRADPLALAAEQAWRHGIVVVTAAGNDGRPVGDLADPALDPALLAVGGDDPAGTLDPADDTVPDFAQHGTVARPVDVIAPATHLLGLRVPGSYVDTLPTNTGQVADRFQRGSGTSEATAVVSGVAALLLQRYPDASPDQVKAMLTGTATPVLRGAGNPAAPGQQLYSGHGLVNVAAAMAAGPGAAPAGTVRAAAGNNGNGKGRGAAAPDVATGTLDGSRGSWTVSAGGVPLTGQQDIFGHPFDSAAMAAAESSASSWSGGSWNGGRWTGDGWTGGRWTTAAWTGTDWAGGAWTGGRWTTMAWSGGRWTGAGWTGGRWTGGRWTSSRWAAADWS